MVEDHCVSRSGPVPWATCFDCTPDSHHPPRAPRGARSGWIRVVRLRAATGAAWGHSTTVIVALGRPVPALFTAITRYSNSTPRGWSLNRCAVSTEVPTSRQEPPSRLRR